MTETGEQADLSEAINAIALMCGIDPGKYGDGEGPASEWRGGSAAYRSTRVQPSGRRRSCGRKRPL